MLMKISTRFMIFLLALCFLSVDVSIGQMPGQIPLKPSKIPQFVDPLPHFAAGLRVNAKAGGNLTVATFPVRQIALSTGTVLPTGTIAYWPPLAPIPQNAASTPSLSVSQTALLSAPSGFQRFVSM